MGADRARLHSRHADPFVELLAVFAVGVGLRRAEVAVVTESPHPDHTQRSATHPPAEHLVSASVEIDLSTRDDRLVWHSRHWQPVLPSLRAQSQHSSSRRTVGRNYVLRDHFEHRRPWQLCDSSPDVLSAAQGHFHVGAEPSAPPIFSETFDLLLLSTSSLIAESYADGSTGPRGRRRVPVLRRDPGRFGHRSGVR